MGKQFLKIMGIAMFVALALGSASSKEQQQAYVNRLQAQCASFGFQYGSQGMANCVSQQNAANVAAAPGNAANANAQRQRSLDLLSGRCDLAGNCR